jgi:antitoxin component of MazEF toxin-antitoxin module
VQILDQIKLASGDTVKFSINASGKIELEPVHQKSNLDEILDSLTTIGETYPPDFNLRDHRKAAWRE